MSWATPPTPSSVTSTASRRDPAAQLRFETVERLPLAEFPPPAYGLIALRQYFIASIQFSSGCPYLCEFCDIPALYGRNPRLKTPGQVLAELDEIAAAGATNVYFVDDNFIGNPKAALALLPHLIDWQTRRRYPLRFSCEATLNLAKNDRVLELMREAGFETVFCGIETPEPRALRAMAKDQNLRMPVLDAVRRLNAYGLEVVSGIILGLDTDDEATADRIKDEGDIRLPARVVDEAASWRNMVMGLRILGRILWRIGVRENYRRTFWRMAWPALRSGDIESLIHMAVVSHHLIEFTRACARGGGEASFYAPTRPSAVA